MAGSLLLTSRMPTLIFHLWFIVTTDQLSQDKAVRERWLWGPGVRAHGRLLLHPRPLPAQWAPLPPRAGGLLGPLRDAQLPGAAVPAAAGGLQALPRMGGCGCPSGLLEEGCGFLLKYFYSTFFSIWKLIKYFLCVSCSYVAVFSFQAPWVDSAKWKLGIMWFFSHVSIENMASS